LSSSCLSWLALLLGPRIFERDTVRTREQSTGAAWFFCARTDGLRRDGDGAQAWHGPCPLLPATATAGPDACHAVRDTGGWGAGSPSEVAQCPHVPAADPSSGRVLTLSSVSVSHSSDCRRPVPANAKPPSSKSD